jgi:hypothetical protein
MRSLIIDPVQRNVAQRDIARVNGLKEWQQLVGGLIEQVIDLGHGDTIWANEKGLLLPGPHHWWTLGDQPVVITGPAFIIGIRNTKGGSTFKEAKMTVAEAQTLVRFLTTDEARERHQAMQAHRRSLHRAKLAGYAKAMGVAESEVIVHYVEGEFPKD